MSSFISSRLVLFIPPMRWPAVFASLDPLENLFPSFFSPHITMHSYANEAWQGGTFSR